MDDEEIAELEIEGPVKVDDTIGSAELMEEDPKLELKNSLDVLLDVSAEMNELVDSNKLDSIAVLLDELDFELSKDDELNELGNGLDKELKLVESSDVVHDEAELGTELETDEAPLEVDTSLEGKGKLDELPESDATDVLASSLVWLDPTEFELELA